jgi:RNA polymerase sigma-70 factor (ECF subfamily)
VDKKTEPNAATPASLAQVRNSIYSELQYVSLQVDGKTYGGWYRVLADGRMELLALANMHRERRAESSPVEQARGMLADFVHAARSKQDSNGSAGANGNGADTSKTEAASSTLGDLLYADPTKIRILEDEWVSLIRSIAASDPLALQQLLERTQRIVFTLVMRLTNDRHSAEELTLDVFEHVWHHAATYDPTAGTVIGWIMNLARAKTMERLQQEGRKQRLASVVDNLEVGSKRNGNGNGFASLFGEGLRDLTPDEREMIETVFFYELGYADAAAELQQHPDTAKARLHSGLDKLRARLAGGATEP